MKKQRFAFIFILFTAFAFSSSAQTPKPTPPPADTDDEVIKVNSRLVVVPVSVTNTNGQPVMGLKAQDFKVLEESKPQQVEQISDAENVPLEIALLLDVSSSANKIFELEKSAAAQFLQNVMRPEDRATIFLISDKPILLQGRDTAGAAAIKIRSVNSATVSTATAFYDSITAAASYLNTNAQPRTRRVILSLSDGEDNYSQTIRNPTLAAYKNLDINKLTQKDLDQRAIQTDKSHVAAQANVLRTLQNTDTVFYTINASGPSVRLNLASRRAQDALQRFADQTGGTAFLPQFATEKSATNFEQLNIRILDGIFRQISAELRAQYLVQYYSEAEFPNNRYVKLEVGLVNPQKLRVRARQGYFVKN